MGMFDYIRVDRSIVLPGLENRPDSLDFQTKSLECKMSTFILNVDLHGKIKLWRALAVKRKMTRKELLRQIEHLKRSIIEFDEEKKRKDIDISFFLIEASFWTLTETFDYWKESNEAYWHDAVLGDLRFYTPYKNKWYEYNAIMKDGICTKIEIVESRSLKEHAKIKEKLLET